MYARFRQHGGAGFRVSMIDGVSSKRCLNAISKRFELEPASAKSKLLGDSGLRMSESEDITSTSCFKHTWNLFESEQMYQAAFNAQLEATQTRANIRKIQGYGGDGYKANGSGDINNSLRSIHAFKRFDAEPTYVRFKVFGGVGSDMNGSDDNSTNLCLMLVCKKFNSESTHAKFNEYGDVGFNVNKKNGSTIIARKFCYLVLSAYKGDGESGIDNSTTKKNEP
ncbi:unnamed protein product [Phytophthora fragariaefolia]|uniref:Unnamed protein product n=1 Tax=Phytophthora fragariaefolia TaxID=1490495 RepID=A0A9W6UB55_9STRA|nr:unnamed protein product [Phytophthora fragariaefolia]